MPLDNDTLIQIASALVIRNGIIAAIGAGAFTLLWVAVSRSGL